MGIAVDELLDAAKTPVVDVDEANHMTCRRADRIDSAVFFDETESGDAELVNLRLLLRRQLAFDADEAPPLLQPRAQVFLLHVRKDARDQLGKLVHVDHAFRVRVKGRALDVGSDQPAVPIENIGTVDRRGDVEETARIRSGGGEAKRDEPHRDQRKGKRESKAGKTEAIAAAGEISALGAGGSGIWSYGLGHGCRRLLG